MKAVRQARDNMGVAKVEAKRWSKKGKPISSAAAVRGAWENIQREYRDPYTEEYDEPDVP
eukprot:919327-Alexandrium_andersonii.AAC.1